MARIFIMGSGVVGSATGRGLVHAGHTVTFVDIAPERLHALRAEGLDARDRIDLRGEPESYVFLTLPTPNDGDRYDLEPLRAGARAVGEALRDATALHTVVVRSTVPPGTTEGVVRPVLEEASGSTEGVGFALAVNPEFLRAVCADDDFRWPWMTVIGARSKRVGERLRDLFAPFGGQVRLVDNPATAEMIKCSHNLYNAAKISFWNEIWMVCQQLGIPHDDVAATVADSAEGSFNRRYGLRGGAPYAGACLPKDTRGFIGFSREVGVEMPLLRAVVDVNHAVAERTGDDLELLARAAGAEATPFTRRVVPPRAARPREIDLRTPTVGRVG